MCPIMPAQHRLVLFDGSLCLYLCVNTDKHLLMCLQLIKKIGGDWKHCTHMTDVTLAVNAALTAVGK